MWEGKLHTQSQLIKDPITGFLPVIRARSYERRAWKATLRNPFERRNADSVGSLLAFHVRSRQQEVWYGAAQTQEDDGFASFDLCLSWKTLERALDGVFACRLCQTVLAKSWERLETFLNR